MYKHENHDRSRGLVEAIDLLLVRQCDVRWNHIEASLVLMYGKMRDLGFRFEDLDRNLSTDTSIKNSGKEVSIRIADGR